MWRSTSTSTSQPSGDRKRCVRSSSCAKVCMPRLHAPRRRSNRDHGRASDANRRTRVGRCRRRRRPLNVRETRTANGLQDHGHCFGWSVQRTASVEPPLEPATALFAKVDWLSGSPHRVGAQITSTSTGLLVLGSGLPAHYSTAFSLQPVPGRRNPRLWLDPIRPCWSVGSNVLSPCRLFWAQARRRRL
jgi:hypothetical protein